MRTVARPNLPPSPHSRDSWETRIAAAIESELAALRTKAQIMYEDRIGAYYSATAAPTGGNWVQGDRVRNSAPAEAGSAGSKYVIIGWICTVTGNPGTWVEMRVLTGS